ncbi:nucleoside monophosphate kinase [Candidatus Babeliales bacterium]|nr:nucleoside monophosphate kinase [Candidatus Babeliales bacterium]
MKRQILIFVGPPGSGKGSLSQMCVDQFGWVQLSTGNLCRKHIAEKTEIGKQIDAALKEGKLVPDRMIINVVEPWILENIAHTSTLILDGYPRTLVQAQSLKDFIDRKLPACSIAVVRLSVDDEEVMVRLLSRATCTNKECQAAYSVRKGSGLLPKHDMICDKCGSPLAKRSDDDRVAIAERLKTYYRHERDLLDFYNHVEIPILELRVDRPLQEIFVELKNHFYLDAS